MDSDRTRLISLFPALAGLPHGLAAELDSRLQWVSVPAGTLMFDAGSPCAGLPLVLEGSIRVTKRSDGGREIGLYRVIPGELCLISLSCLLGGDDYPATGIAVEPVRLAALPRPQFTRLVEGHAPFREMVFHLYAERLAGLMQLVEEGPSVTWTSAWPPGWSSRGRTSASRTRASPRSSTAPRRR